MANKLELTWYGKDEPIRVEPRLLIENTELSNTAADSEALAFHFAHRYLQFLLLF